MQPCKMGDYFWHTVETRGYRCRGTGVELFQYLGRTEGGGETPCTCGALPPHEIPADWLRLRMLPSPFRDTSDDEASGGLGGGVGAVAWQSRIEDMWDSVRGVLDIVGVSNRFAHVDDASFCLPAAHCSGFKNDPPVSECPRCYWFGLSAHWETPWQCDRCGETFKVCQDCEDWFLSVDDAYYDAHEPTGNHCHHLERQ